MSMCHRLVGTFRWQQDDFGPGVLIEKVTHGDEAAITIHDQMAGVLQEPVLIISQVTAHLCQPRGVRTRCDASNVDRREDGRDFPQSLATDGMSLYGKQSTLVIVEQQSLFSELLQKGVNLSVLELNDLLLTLVHKDAKGGQHDVPRLENRRHVRRRNRPVSGADG